jgi:hypothetical protein
MKVPKDSRPNGAQDGKDAHPNCTNIQPPTFRFLPFEPPHGHKITLLIGMQNAPFYPLGTVALLFGASLV